MTALTETQNKILDALDDAPPTMFLRLNRKIRAATIQWIAQSAGVSDSHARRSIKSLELHGLVKVMSGVDGQRRRRLIVMGASE